MHPCHISSPIQKLRAGYPARYCDFTQPTCIRSRVRALFQGIREETMVRWYYQSIFDELEDMRKYMDSLSRQMYGTGSTALLPGPVEPATKLLSENRAGLRVDVADNDREVVVTADMIPGVSKQDITLTLITPQALEISCERKEETQDKNEGYFLRERRFGSVTRIIPLPRPVLEEGARASFKNGVLEVHLKKSSKELKGKISID